MLLLSLQLIPTPLGCSGHFAAHLCMVIDDAKPSCYDSKVASSRLQLVAEGFRRASAVITRPTALHQAFLPSIIVPHNQVETLLPAPGLG